MEQPPLEDGHIDSKLEALSAESAQGKLHRIEGNYFQYGVRFASLNEFRQIVENGKFEPAEVFVPELSQFADLRLPSGEGGTYKFKEPLPLNDYIKNQGNGGSWRETAWLQTNWQPSLGAIKAHELLMRILEDQRHRAHESGKLSREQILSQFRDRILFLADPSIPSTKKPMYFERQYDPGHISWMTCLQAIMEIKKMLKNEDRQNDSITLRNLFEGTNDSDSQTDSVAVKLRELKANAKTLSPDDLYVLSELIDSTEFIKDDDNLRKVIDALSHALMTTDQPYEIALFFSTEVISGQSTWKHYWRNLRSSDDSPKQAEGLLAVAAAISDKNLTAELKEIAMKAGQFSCPVFSAEGVLAYPG